jgi:hypothetical protein
MTTAALRHWLRTHFGKGRTPPPRKRRAGPHRLSFELLETRLVPSLVTWTGAGDHTSWSDPRNWDSHQLPDAAALIDDGDTDELFGDDGTDWLLALGSDHRKRRRG